MTCMGCAAQKLHLCLAIVNIISFQTCQGNWLFEGNYWQILSLKNEKKKKLLVLKVITPCSSLQV